MRKLITVLALAASSTAAQAYKADFKVTAPIPACEAMEENQQCVPGMLKPGEVFLFDDSDAMNKVNTSGSGPVVELWRCSHAATPVYVSLDDMNRHFEPYPASPRPTDWYYEWWWHPATHEWDTGPYANPLHWPAAQCWKHVRIDEQNGAHPHGVVVVCALDKPKHPPNRRP